MFSTTRDAKQRAKARRRRYRTAHERLARDRRQAQHAAEALQQALDALGLPADLVTEIEGRLRSQHKLLGKIVGVMCPICAYLRPFPPTYPSRHLLLTAETWASSLCQPCPHSAFLMPPTPRPATQKAAQTWEARLEAGL